MASLSQIIPGGFNSQAVEPQAAFDNEPLPPGLYTVEITGADVKELKKGGTGLNIECTVIDPAQFAKRKAWKLLCIQHANAQTEQIAQSQLSAICRAVGIAQLDDTDQLFGRVLRIRTKVRPADGQYAAQTEITSFEPAGAAMPTTSAPAAAAPAGAKAAPPWARKAA